MDPDDLDIDEWRMIDGFSDYAVSIYGEIYRFSTNSLISQSRGSDRAKVSLKERGKWYLRAVPTLVAKAFVPGKTELKCTVDHVDTDPWNNCADNLEWVTQEENNKRWAIYRKAHRPDLCLLSNYE